MKELLLVRHAKSDRNIDVSDIERPLKKRGKRDAKNVGEWLKKKNLLPDMLLSSPARRAIDTARLIFDELDVDGLVIHEDEFLYAADVKQLKSVLANCPETAQRVLLVGHNPELEDLLIYLVGADELSDAEKLLPTAALARLTLETPWSDLHEGCAELSSITYAKTLLDE